MTGPATRAADRGHFAPCVAGPATQAADRGHFAPAMTGPATRAADRGHFAPAMTRPATQADDRGRLTGASDYYRPRPAHRKPPPPFPSQVHQACGSKPTKDRGLIHRSRSAAANLARRYGSPL